ncbi:hypothetical protein RhiirA5_493561 [Rhizophagus irregularis]|uniref:Uncharacterized protein n=3 Tax=Rhizophagus irregularis TaxID=588596 RepID=A0A2I1DSQ3_9GLOM|nr:hypothetical protein RirG_002030 [Rhizophagus irregularis DAOM 197198w]PKC16706.1 hypothetical protein RhiirA5_493561 [Rhizophagus irregularis]GBC19988.1 hypothetical protein GLOIN_2v1844795 [Rhizophagus irregularis DAOM 181602=DAOM 197198]PKC65656.1 hypothetical protein RhiirA1_536177 [Rhizophagus irregularis]PKY12887.1 hypothetical protein RhiirB3_518378 [Rhizophagus irregularis]
MITKFRIHFLIYNFFFIFFLIQEIFSIEDSSNQGYSNLNQNDDKIRCGKTCLASIGSACVVIVVGSAFAIFRFQKKHSRQKTGDLEEIVTVKYEDANPSFETINTQPVFQNTQAAQDHTKAT